MNCQKIETFIGDIAREQIMGSDVREDVLTHCETCCSCAKKLVEQRTLTSALRELAKSAESVEASHLVENNLLAALRIHVAAKQVSKTRSRWMYGAVAAALLIITSSAAIRVYVQRSDNQGPGTTQPPNLSNASTTHATVTAGNVSRVNTAKMSSPRPQKTKSASRRGVTSAPKPTKPITADYASEIATEFLPLGYGNTLNLQEGGQIVRVEVPRSALVSFGLPVSMNRQTERVKADVLFGADGSARAIRFVQ